MRWHVCLLAAAAVALLASCATTHKPPADASTRPSGEDSQTRENLPNDDEWARLPLLTLPIDLDPVEDFEQLDPSPLEDLSLTPPDLSPEAMERERLLAEKGAPPYDIPMVLNDRVLRWVDHYAHRRPDAFRPGLVRSGRYLKMIHRIFEEEGLPLDLAYMAHVESAYKPTAYSRARAKGVFQFIAGTGKKYGLAIDFWVDERSDPEKAARAATAYLKDLYAEFGDWYLALAAYNAGEGRIRRGLARTGAKDFWELARTRAIRAETRNYVPAILAVVLISKNPGKYGFSFEPDPPVVYDTIRVDDAVDLRVLARCAGTDVATLKSLNPALRRHQTPPGRAFDVHVPQGSGVPTLAALEQVPPDERVLYALHKIRNGDSLWKLSRRYGVSIRGIQDANGMGRRTTLRVGRVLKIPTAAAASYANVETWNAAPSMATASSAPSGTVQHTVRRGDTLSSIARRYGTSARAIAAANGISVHKTLYPGERLDVGRHAGAVSDEGGEVRAVHTVRRGDTLSSIARRYGTSARSIAAANGISVHKTLYPGDPLEIGGGAAARSGGAVVHTVRRGDTLWRIASLYRTSVKNLCVLNDIRTDTILRPGRKLTVRSE